jgi:hypothetical protein
MASIVRISTAAGQSKIYTGRRRRAASQRRLREFALFSQDILFLACDIRKQAHDAQ